MDDYISYLLSLTIYLYRFPHYFRSILILIHRVNFPCGEETGEPRECVFVLTSTGTNSVFG